MNEVLITIAIPTYNRKILLKRAIDSILSQKYDCEIEVLVSDNASDDGTDKMMINEYPNVSYFRNDSNIGADANFANCLKKANGKYTLLLGSDDVLVESTLNKLCEFLKNDEFNLVFLNHVFFKNGYSGVSNCSKPYINSLESDFITKNKKEFMAYCGHRVSFMSCLLFNTRIVKSTNIDKYINMTSFIHTCIAFEITSWHDATLGIFHTPCVADDLSDGQGTVSKDSSCVFKIFGYGMHYAFCELGPKYNYDQKQMDTIYYSFAVPTLRNKIIRLKAERKNDEWKGFFMKYYYPVINNKLSYKLQTMAAFYTPKIVCMLMCRYLRPLYKHIKP